MEWQPIETAPKDGTAVLLCWAIDADGDHIRWEKSPKTAGVFVQVGSWREGYVGEWSVYLSTPDDGVVHFEPTHWMQLPASPSAQAG